MSDLTDYQKKLKRQIKEAESSIRYLTNEVKRTQAEIEIAKEVLPKRLADFKHKIREKKLDIQFYVGCLGDIKKGKLKLDGYEDLDLEGGVGL